MDSNRSFSSINTEAENTMLDSGDDLILTDKVEQLASQLDNAMEVDGTKKKQRRVNKTNVNKSVAVPTDSSGDVLSILLDMKKTQFTKKEGVALGKSLDVKFVAINTELKAHSGRFVEIEDRMANFETKLENATYERELTKQQSLKQNISIFGCPKKENEVIIEVALRIFKAFGKDFEQSDFEAVYRTAGKRPNFSTIIVKFVNFEKKLAALNNKGMSSVKLCDIFGDQSSTTQIYLNNHVTPFFGRLLAAGRQAMKDQIIHSCWIGATGCLIKTQENGKAVCIRSIEAFDSLRVNAGTSSSSTAAANPKRTKPDDHKSPVNKSKKLR